jgi:molecular chaperone DnaK
MSRAIGIDLGTTNSVASVLIDGKAQIIRSRDDEYFTPSVVGYWLRDKVQLVGRAALNCAALAPEDTIFSIKRLMGVAYDDPNVAELIKRYPYRVLDRDDGSPGVRVKVGPHLLTPVDVSAMVLRALAQDAARALGEEVSGAVITVPAYFTDAQREATRIAGNKAGLAVLKIIDEPTAAAIAFGMDHLDEPHRVLVYDLGGGTFDISVLQMMHGQFEGMVITGDRWFGGDDFDRLIVDTIGEWVQGRYGFDPKGDRRYLMLAKLAAEQAKFKLSEEDGAEITIPYGVRAPDDGTPFDIDLKLTREAFERSIRPHVERSLGLVRKALTEQNLTHDDITRVLLVGGSTQVPLVRQALAAMFGPDKVDVSVDPMQAVAIGAAHMAARLHVPGMAPPRPESVAGFGLTEVTAHGLGIETVDADGRPNCFSVVIPKGTPYPLETGMERSYRTTSVGVLRIPVYEGDNPVASKNELQGIVQVDLPQEVAVSTQVVLRFNYDADRVVTVHVRVCGHDGLTCEKPLQRERAPAPVDDDWSTSLKKVLEVAEHFLASHRELLEPGARAKMQSDISKARQALAENKPSLGSQVANALNMALHGSGVASTIFLSERAEEWGRPSDRDALRQARRNLQEAIEKGDDELKTRLDRWLQAMIMTLLEARGRARTSEGLLRALEHGGPASDRTRT